MNKTKIDIDKIALDFAIENGFDACSVYDNSGKTPIYVADYKSKEILFIGYPSFIVISENKARFLTGDETLKLMDISPVEDKNFSESL